MVAPSFPVDFEKKPLIAVLRKLGFAKIADHTAAIVEVNRRYEEFFAREKFGAPVIAANCPSTVVLINTRFPSLVKYLPNIPSPMIVNAELCRKWWPENLNVFIGPCLVKKQEAKNHPEIELVLTFKEIKTIFDSLSLSFPPRIAVRGKLRRESSVLDHERENETFDSPKGVGVEIFPASGGVKATIKRPGCRKIIVGEETLNLIKMFEDLEKNQGNHECLFFDVLACPGGCIGGPGVASTAATAARRQKLLNYVAAENINHLCSEADLA